MSFFFFSVFPLERWDSNIKGHFYIVNLFTDSPFAFILEKYVLCQWVAIWPSISDHFLGTSTKCSLVSRGAHIFWCVTIPEAFFKMAPALCYSSLRDEGNNCIVYLPGAVTNTRGDSEQSFQLQLGCSPALGRRNDGLIRCIPELSEPFPWCAFHLSEIWANLDRGAKGRNMGRSVNLQKHHLSTCSAGPSYLC